MADRLAIVTAPAAVADALGKLRHAAAHGERIGGRILSSCHQPAAGGQPQRGVQRRALLGGVDDRARQQRVAACFDPALARQAKQRIADLDIDPLLGAIEQDAGGVEREAIEAV